MNVVFGPNVSVALAMVSTNRVASQLKPLGVNQSIVYFMSVHIEVILDKNKTNKQI